MVAAPVVDGLEPVEVEREQREVPVGPAVLLHGQVEQGAPVEQAGQRVVPRPALAVLFGLHAARGELLERAEDAGAGDDIERRLKHQHAQPPLPRERGADQQGRQQAQHEQHRQPRRGVVAAADRADEAEDGGSGDDLHRDLVRGEAAQGHRALDQAPKDHEGEMAVDRPAPSGVRGADDGEHQPDPARADGEVHRHEDGEQEAARQGNGQRVDGQAVEHADQDGVGVGEQLPVEPLPNGRRHAGAGVEQPHEGPRAWRLEPWNKPRRRCRPKHLHGPTVAAGA